MGHVCSNALENLEVPSQEYWACTYAKGLEEAQNKLSGLSVQGAASSWNVSRSHSDIHQGDLNTLSSFCVGSLLSAEKRMYGMQEEGVPLGCTNIRDRNETLTSVSAT